MKNSFFVELRRLFICLFIYFLWKVYMEIIVDICLRERYLVNELLYLHVSTVNCVVN